MKIMRDVSITAARGAQFDAAELAAMAQGGGRLPMAALDFATEAWRIAGRTVENPVYQGRLDLPAQTGGETGLVLEPGRTNLVFPSAVAPISWGVNGGTSVSVAAGAVFAGLNGAVITSGTTEWGRAYSNQIAMTSGASYAVSVWVRAGTSGKLRIEIYGTGIDLIVSGTIGALAINYQAGGTLSNLTQTDLGSGNWLVQFKAVPTVSASNVTLGIGPSSTTNGKTVIAYAAQVEAGTTATSYLPSTTAAATRAVDAPWLPLGGWFNPVEGALRLAVQPLAQQAQVLATVTNAADQALLTLASDATGAVSLAAPGVMIAVAPLLTVGAPQALHLRWGPSGASLTFGAATATGGPLALHGASTLTFGPANALVKSVAIWDRSV